MATTSKRLLTLLSLLHSRRDWPGAVLAERLEVSPRTVRRDVDRLRDLGYRITPVKGPDGGYRLVHGTSLPPLLFDDDQAVALVVALQTAPATGAVVEEAAARALTTVRQVLPSRLRHRVEAIRVTPDRRREAVDPSTLTAVSAATHAGEILRFVYATGKEEEGQTRRVEPYGVVAHAGRLYLVAWDLDRDDWRTFRLDRMAPRAGRGPRFRPRDVPGGSVADFLAGRFRGTDGSTTEWPCRGEVIVDVALADVAPYVHDGAVEEVTATRCRVTLGAWSWPALAARIGQLDVEVEVVGPDELRSAFDLLARRFARTAAKRGTGSD